MQFFISKAAYPSRKFVELLCLLWLTYTSSQTFHDNLGKTSMEVLTKVVLIFSFWKFAFLSCTSLETWSVKWRSLVGGVMKMRTDYKTAYVYYMDSTKINDYHFRTDWSSVLFLTSTGSEEMQFSLDFISETITCILLQFSFLFFPGFLSDRAPLSSRKLWCYDRWWGFSETGRKCSKYPSTRSWTVLIPMYQFIISNVIAKTLSWENFNYINICISWEEFQIFATEVSLRKLMVTSCVKHFN